MSELTVSMFNGCKVEEYINRDGMFHRVDGPARIEYDSNGRISQVQWKFEGLYHNENGPAFILYHEDGLIAEEHYYENGEQHRDDNLPAIITYFKNGKNDTEQKVKSEEYMINDKLHRFDGPASITYDKEGNVKDTTWYIHGYEVEAPKKKWPLSPEDERDMRIKHISLCDPLPLLD